ncbi:MAG TPA: AI-2E family transporter [Acidimicrobiales bacterium]
MTLSSSENDGVPSRRSLLLKRAESYHVPLMTILVTIGIIILVYFTGRLLYRLRDILVLMIVGGFVALILNPLVVWFQHHHVARRGFAVAIVMGIAVLVFLGLAFAFGYPLVNALTHLANKLPTYVREAEHNRGWIGHLLHKYHVQRWVEKNSSKLISFAKGLSKPALKFGEGAATLVLALVTLFAFVVLLLLESPKIRRFGLSNLAPAKSAWIARVGAEISKVALGYMVGSMIMSILAGFVIFITLLCVSVPFALVFGLWVALVDFLPQIGGALAGIPVVLFALVHSVQAGVVTFIVFMVYTQLENHVLRPVIMSRSVKINALTVFIAILIGAEVGSWVAGDFGGLIGVLLAVPAAATVHVISREVWNLTRAPTGFVVSHAGEEDPSASE